MTIVDLYSKRQKILRGEAPDILDYDKLPKPLKVQIVHIWSDTLGEENEYYHSTNGNVRQIYMQIVKTLCREYGFFKLPNTKDYRDRIYIEELVDYFIHESDTEKLIDVIELSFFIINESTSQQPYLMRDNASALASNAINELNNRFKEHGVGYQFIENKIIRTDSELLHVETVKPALNLLNQRHYKGAQQEFLGAYEHYRLGKNKESLNDCLKSFESTMKAICDKKNGITMLMQQQKH